ncbi:MAG: flagellar basal body protein, partial [Ilumatobacteraceae bacterium]
MQTVLQIAAEAARQTQLAQSVVSHNLANASTTAFKADLYQAESLYVLGG